MRAISLILLGLLAACQGSPNRGTEPDPNVPLAAEWPQGQRFAATVKGGLPDKERWRATTVWWREALRQSDRFSLALQPARDTPALELAIDPAAKNATVSLLANGESQLLAATRYGQGAPSRDLLAAIDRLAWSARQALGEDVARPLPVGAITSRDAKVVLAVDDAHRLIELGSIPDGYQALLRARQLDGGAPFVLQPLAACELLFAKADVSERIVKEALSYSNRSSPTNAHLLGRGLLLAQGAGNPENVADYDNKLLQFAKLASSERPDDDEVRQTLALAHVYRAQFAEAEQILRPLVERLPERPYVRYYLGWCLLATNQPAEAATQLGEAALRMPSTWVMLPRAIALYEAGRHSDLARVLRTTAKEHDPAGTGMLSHQVRRMQAAHAILQNDREAATKLLFDNMQWLAQHPLTLKTRAGEFAETGALLVRIGGDNRLANLLAITQQQHTGTPIADSCAFVSGMLQIATTGKVPDNLLESLRRGGDSAWASRLLAFLHERRGEVGQMQTELARASRLSSSPMTKALLARSLRAVGKQQEADLLHNTLRRELQAIHLRKPCQHPLYGPELAFAFALR